MTKFWFLKELGSRSSSKFIWLSSGVFFLIFVNISPKRLIKVKTLKTLKMNNGNMTNSLPIIRWFRKTGLKVFVSN